MADVVDSGWLVHGPRHGELERALATLVGARHALGVASGTDALELALRATVPAGRDVVVTTANCGGYTTTAARRAGFTVRYSDVDPSTALLDPADLPRVLDERVGAVVVTHLYGGVADVAAVREAAATVGAAVVEDCAQAIGATGVEGPVGGLADAATFSFYPTKNLGALGDGGAVTTSRDEVADAVRDLRQYGWQDKYTIGLDGGRNSRLDEMQAAVLLARLPLLDGWNRRRREIVAAYAAAAQGLQLLPQAAPGHVGHLAVVVAPDRTGLGAHLARHQVQSGVHYPVADHRQPAFATEHAAVDLPVTDRLTQQVLTVPLFPELTDDEVERVCAALASY